MLTATLRRKMRLIPSKDTADLGFRRLRYVRYCDDHLLGFAGPKAEAQDIKNRVAAFLRDELNLELSQSKTLITHARTGAARFLGYEITVQHADHKVTGKRRSINGAVGLRGCVNLSWPRCSSLKWPHLVVGRSGSGCGGVGVAVAGAGVEGPEAEHVGEPADRGVG